MYYITLDYRQETWTLRISDEIETIIEHGCSSLERAFEITAAFVQFARVIKEKVQINFTM
jgi:hypothetical protein